MHRIVSVTCFALHRKRVSWVVTRHRLWQRLLFGSIYAPTFWELRTGMTEEEYWKQHYILSNEITNTIESFYTWKNVNNYAAEHQTALAKMNVCPTFWNTMLHGLQTTFIITLAR